MGSNFKRILAASEYVQDRIFGDEQGWSFQPMRTPPNRRPIPDVARTAIDNITCTFENMPVTVMVGGEERTSSVPLISCQKIALPGRVVKGDRFIRQEDGKIYQVEKPGPDHLTRWRFEVQEQEE